LVAREETEREKEVEAVASELNTRSNIKVAKPPTFNEDANKVSGFIAAYKLHIRMRIRNISVEEEIQWVLLYM